MSVKIYTTGWCLPCKNAKKLLSDNSVQYEELNIEELGITRNDLYNLTGGRTVPQIIINGNGNMTHNCENSLQETQGNSKTLAA